MPIVSIVEAKEIIRRIKDKYNYDFSSYSSTAFRYKIDKTITSHFLKFPDILASRLLEDPEFFDEFLYDISVPSSEMFRDTGFWKCLINELLPKIPVYGNTHVWFPDIVAGNELFSFLITLKETQIQGRMKISASSLSKKSLTTVRSGKIHLKTIDQCFKNFKDVFYGKELTEHLIYKDGDYYLHTDLLKSVSFGLHNLQLKPAPENVNIIFFRNKLINYTREYQNYLLDFFVETLEPGGYLMTGYQEEVMKHFLTTMKMEYFNMKECMYRKIV